MSISLRETLIYESNTKVQELERLSLPIGSAGFSISKGLVCHSIRRALAAFTHCILQVRAFAAVNQKWYCPHLAHLLNHEGCSDLRLQAIVGGCNLFYNPDTMITETDLQFLSPESKCHSFDHRANGYARGEGIGVVVIKRLSKALEDGNTIRAVIRATAANQDGRTPGITQPSSTQQEHLIRQAYRAAGLPLEDTTYFEVCALIP